MKRHLLFIFLLCFTIGLSAQSDAAGSEQATFSAQTYSSIEVFPNPATAYIGVNAPDQVSLIKVFNLVGRHMKTFVIAQDEKHYIGDLPRGMYLVQLVNHQDKVVTTKRLNKR